ncbi:12-oxophytodienoate reductase [Rhodococcus sp. BP-149]|uniref:oxidoreductase n=1 Tax=unclassified Rhodococcus (in: high G+C Gram-positive bacteria) TaxID=192944 RepID=UPI001C9A9937|nr:MULTISPECIES: 12-oxophytodienoate reductase [unclassified Rhodococcus (in: high G+C Gram-positive bacteria)]MBY6685620.1 12-oxophytodienoate reductase [Rhodococcus sp. BP-288]MBY6694832.1 12-oxophytodienoate reductase [Rhodococcus sp. BP-188]MBY6696678.1 12-oxophytodienoate reductase [Rhodococcus sp. BP-285]MBY6703334.1 12-oxophytodienoate reductase [Rhodococcus sp. BP-283]MBY6710712.1 12-oxophytodienoate reductase [Rhodococcus sp. BP-160]
MQSDSVLADRESLTVDPLFSPVTLGSTTVRNRFFLPAMQRGSRGYRPTAGMASTLRATAEQGPGLIITEGAAPEHPAGYWQPAFSILGRGTADDWGHVVREVTSTGDVVVLMQLWHPGALRLVVDGIENPYPHHPAWSPSGLIQEGRHNGVAMTAQDLEDTKNAYVDSAVIARSLGAHGIELHCAHGYLLDLFLWHETNVRTDEYGGDTLVERASYPAEIFAAIRAATGPDFIISVRFSQWKEVDYGAKIAQHPDDLGPFLDRLERAGANVFHISARRFDAPGWPELDTRRSVAAWVKDMTSLPVMTIGSVGLSTDLASDVFDDKEPLLQVEEDIVRVRHGLDRGDFDLIGVGRAQISNPDFVDRVRRGDYDGLREFRKYRDLAEAYESYSHEGQLVDQSRKGD